MPTKKYLVACDIDGTLTPDSNGGIVDPRKILPCIQKFKSRRMTLDIEGVLYLLPIGVIELIQLIDKYPDVELAFFSAGTHKRNEQFVKKLLCFALGVPRYKELKPTLKIMSRHHLKRDGADVFGKKDLSIFDHDIENIIIIDDNLQMFNNEHISNVLSIIPINIPAIHKIHESSLTHPGTLFHWDSFVDDVHLDDYFASTNQLFYVAGVLFTALNKAQNQQISLREALASIQFKTATKNERNIDSFDEQLSNDPEFYFTGLQLLQQKNEHLFFVDDIEFLGHYFPLSPQVLHENMLIEKFADLSKTIHRYILCAPRMLHGLFAGQLPRNLRDIQKQLTLIKNEDSSHQEAILTIISIAQKMGDQHPILKAAKAYNQLLRNSVIPDQKQLTYS